MTDQRTTAGRSWEATPVGCTDSTSKHSAIAAKIGPTVDEVHTPLEDTGYRAPAAFGYRPFEGGLALKRLAPARN